jgi:hypothetical protein
MRRVRLTLADTVAPRLHARWIRRAASRVSAYASAQLRLSAGGKRCAPILRPAYDHQPIRTKESTSVNTLMIGYDLYQRTPKAYAALTQAIRSWAPGGTSSTQRGSSAPPHPGRGAGHPQTVPPPRGHAAHPCAATPLVGRVGPGPGGRRLAARAAVGGESGGGSRGLPPPSRCSGGPLEPPRLGAP